MADKEPGKRRSTANRIGAKGEAMFKAWAVDRGLSANKVDEDFGVDFLCEHLVSEGGGVERATGAVLAAFVRSTKGKSRPRILIDKDDAARLVESDLPACLFGVNTATGDVRFYFRTESALKSLLAFLGGTAASKSFPLERMAADASEFDELLRKYVRPAVQARLRLLRAELWVQHGLGAAHVELHQTTTGSDALVLLPWVGTAFEFDDDEDREDARARVFGKGEPPHLGLPGARLSQYLAPLLDLTETRLFLGGGLEDETTLTVTTAGSSETIPVTKRTLDDEIAFTHPCGLCFSMSGVRWVDGQPLHYLRFDVYPEPEVLLGGDEALLRLLRGLKPGAEVSFGSKGPMPIERWPDSMVVGPGVEALVAVCKTHGLDLGEFSLADFTDEEFGGALGCLEALTVQSVPLNRLMPGFVFEQACPGPGKWPRTEPVYLRVPLVMNLKTRGVIVWIEGDGDFFLTEDGKVCGVRFGEQHEVEVEFLDERFEKPIEPELWLYEDWPALPLPRSQVAGLEASNDGHVLFGMKHREAGLSGE